MFELKILGFDKIANAEWATADVSDDVGFMKVECDFKNAAGTRYISAWDVKVTRIDDYHLVNGWIGHNDSGQYVIGPQCLYAQAPSDVRRVAETIVRRVVRQIAKADVISEDALLLARELSGIDLQDPMERLRAAA